MAGRLSNNFDYSANPCCSDAVSLLLWDKQKVLNKTEPETEDAGHRCAQDKCIEYALLTF